MLDGVGLWELVEQRAARHPRRPLAVDEAGRRPHLRRAARRRRAGGRRPRRPRRRRGHGRVLAAARRGRVDGPGGRAGPARCGAEPDPPDLPRPRGGLRRPPGRHPPADRALGVAGLRLRRPWPSDLAATDGGPRWSSSPTGSCPTATRPTCPPRPDRPATGALALLHVGHDRRPEGRTPHRRHHPGGGGRHGRAPRPAARRPQRPGVPLHPHRRDHLAVRQPAWSGSTNILTEAFDPVATTELLQREDVTLAGVGHAVPPGLPGRAAGGAGRARCSRTSGPSPAAARPSRRSSTTTSRPSSAGSGSSPATG